MGGRAARRVATPRPRDNFMTAIGCARPRLGVVPRANAPAYDAPGHRGDTIAEGR